MEKQGMDRRGRLFRPGLLIFLFLLFFLPGMLFSQADEGGGEDESPVEEIPPLEVRVETSSSNPMVGSPWAVYILVNHPRASEVNITPPRFPPAVVLERVRTETRLIRKEIPAPLPLPAEDAEAAGTTDEPGTVTVNERWTRVEFLFTPRTAGPVTLSPFGASIPGRQALTEAITVRFREAPRTVRRYEPRFRWIGAAPVPCGERRELVLELSNFDPRKLPPQSIFQANMPRSAILEEDPPAEAGDGIYRYTIGIIPLEEKTVNVDSFTFSAEGFTLTVPALEIQVLPAPAAEKVSPVPIEEEVPAEPLLENENSPPPFPEYQEKVFPLFQNEYRRITARVRNLWESGRRVEALAELRRNERDSFSGPSLAPIRRGMEQALGLDLTEDESWRPLRIPLSVWILFGFIVFSAGIFMLVFRPRGVRPRRSSPRNESSEKNVTSRRRSGFKTIIIVALSICVAFIFLDEGLSKFLMGNFLVERLSSAAKTAVLSETAAYRVPDLKGAVNTWFNEGQPVTVGDYRGEWCYAESPDGRSGWVPRTAVFGY